MKFSIISSLSQGQRTYYSKSSFVIFFGLLFLYLFLTKNKTDQTVKLSDSDKSDLTDEEVFEEILAQDDPRLINYIRRKHLVAPSEKPYNLVDPFGNPGELTHYALEILGNKRDGFFVESGAWDGETLSTTLTLERDYGWNGFLPEPNRKSYALLSAKNRKAWTANVCLSPINRPQLVDFGEVPKGQWWHQGASGIQKYLKHHLYKDVNKVPCFTIFSILSALNITTVDWFSLDIEGAELDVLKTIPFDKILIKIFNIEWNLIPEGKDELKRFVESKGFNLYKEVGMDVIFVHDSIPIEF